MRIIILLQKWEGGVGVVVRNLKKELEKKGHSVNVFARQNDWGIYSFMGSVFKLRRFIKKTGKDYDIIYTQDWSMTLPLLLPFHLFKEKHFCCFHGIQPGSASIFQKITGKIMGKKLIVIGDSLKEMFPKSNLIFNGARLDIFKPLKKIKKIKNSVGFANWKIKVYNYEKIKKAVEEAGKEFIVAEGIPYEKMPEFYNKVETFISLPPIYTSCAMVWLEALACGVPKIIGNHAGIRFPINYIEDFSNIKDALLNAKEKSSKKFPFNKFTWEYHSSNLIKVFNGKSVEGKY